MSKPTLDMNAVERLKQKMLQRGRATLRNKIANLFTPTNTKKGDKHK